MDSQQLTLILGGSVLLGVLAMLVVIALQQRQIVALTNAMKEVNANPQVLDLVEAMATKVVPVEVVKPALAAMDILGQLVQNKDLKALISEVEKFGQQVTDGLPNTIPKAAPLDSGSVG